MGQHHHYHGQAAILIVSAIPDVGEESVLLTKRAEHLTLHSGEVAFPGGMWEAGDKDLRETALRECQEEVGLTPSRVAVLHQLPVAKTRNGTRVTPFIGRVESTADLRVNPGELDALFWVPLSFLLDDLRIRTDIFRIGGAEYWAPVYEWESFTIWGFTARVLIDALHYWTGHKIVRDNSAPEIIFRP